MFLTLQAGLKYHFKRGKRASVYDLESQQNVIVARANLKWATLINIASNLSVTYDKIHSPKTTHSVNVEKLTWGVKIAKIISIMKFRPDSLAAKQGSYPASMA